MSAYDYDLFVIGGGLGGVRARCCNKRRETLKNNPSLYLTNIFLNLTHLVFALEYCFRNNPLECREG
jgi:hypothetical protein